jgi:hypothetical protein
VVFPSAVTDRVESQRGKNGMNENSSSHVGRNALIATVVAILMNPISVVLGYYLNHILEKPRLSIEYVSDTYDIESHALNAEVAKTLSSNPDIAENLREVLTRLASERGQEPCIDWLNDGDWDDRCIPIVKEVATGIIGALRARVASGAAPTGSQPSPAAAMQKLAVLESLLRNMQEMEKTDTQRTGKVSFPVGVLNTGDSDGIIYNRGRLKFEGKELWIYADAYTVVKSHSLQEVKFMVVENDQDPIAVARWQELVNSHKEAQFELILKTAAKDVEKTSTLHK